jgi:hypothetical protein
VQCRKVGAMCYRIESFTSHLEPYKDQLVSCCGHFLSIGSTGCVCLQEKALVLPDSRRSPKYQEFSKPTLANSHQLQHATKALADRHTPAGKATMRCILLSSTVMWGHAHSRDRSATKEQPDGTMVPFALPDALHL